MYQEELVIKECYKRITNVLTGIKDYDYEIICIDDGSKDNTFEILREIALTDDRVKVISFTRNFGHQAAVIAGLQNVSGNCAIIIDADLQDPPELIPDMLKLWEEGNKIVLAIKNGAEESKIKYGARKLYYKQKKKITDIEHIIPL